MILYPDVRVGKTYLVSVTAWKDNEINRPNKPTKLTVTEKHDNMVGFRELYSLYKRSELIFLREVQE